MTPRRIALVYAACALAGFLIALVGFHDREPRDVKTLPAGPAVPISLPRVMRP